MNDSQKKILIRAISYLQTLKVWYEDFNKFAVAFGYPEGLPAIEYWKTYEEYRTKYNIGQPYSILKDTAKRIYRMRKRFDDNFPARFYMNHLQDIGMCFMHVYCSILSSIIHPINIEDEQIRTSQGVEINECLDFLKAQL